MRATSRSATASRVGGLLPHRRRAMRRRRDAARRSTCRRQTLGCTTRARCAGRGQPREGAAPRRPPGRPPDDRPRRRRGHGRRASRPAPATPGSWRLAIDAPAELARYIAPKGSIAVDGVSLTVNGVAGTRFHVNLIPHTLAVTTLRRLARRAGQSRGRPGRALRRAATRRHSRPRTDAARRRWRNDDGPHDTRATAAVDRRTRAARRPRRATAR